MLPLLRTRLNTAFLVRVASSTEIARNEEHLAKINRALEMNIGVKKFQIDGMSGEFDHAAAMKLRNDIESRLGKLRGTRPICGSMNLAGAWE